MLHPCSDCTRGVVAETWDDLGKYPAIKMLESGPPTESSSSGKSPKHSASSKSLSEPALKSPAHSKHDCITTETLGIWKPKYNKISFDDRDHHQVSASPQIQDSFTRQRYNQTKQQHIRKYNALGWDRVYCYCNLSAEVVRTTHRNSVQSSHTPAHWLCTLMDLLPMVPSRGAVKARRGNNTLNN